MRDHYVLVVLGEVEEQLTSTALLAISVRPSSEQQDGSHLEDRKATHLVPDQTACIV
jgi:hypothetical protein